MDRIFCGCNTAIVWNDLTSADTGSPVTTATVTASLYSLSGGSPITSCSLTYDSDLAAYTGSLTTVGSTGNQLVSENTEYILEIEAVLGSTIGLKKRRVVAKYDNFDD